jgi:hypothetical protein
MATATQSNGKAVAKFKGAGDTVASTAKSASRPALTAGAAAAGLVGGVALGARLGASQRGGFGLRRKSGVALTIATMGKLVKELSSTTDDIHQVREELEKANRQSPVEVLLDGLTHRRGAHKRES